MEKYRYNFRYSDNKRHFEFFKDALANSGAMLRHISLIISKYEADAKQYIVNKFSDVEAEAPIHKLSPKEILWEDPAELQKIDFFSGVLSHCHGGPAKDPVGFMLKLYCERDDLSARVEQQQANMAIWERRIELYAPVFEKDSQEANENFEKIWEKAKRVLEKNPQQMVLALIVRDYPLEEQKDPEFYNQDLKNECYKALKAQIAFIEKEKSGSGMRKI